MKPSVGNSFVFCLDANTIKEHRWFFNAKFTSEVWYATHYHARSLKYNIRKLDFLCWTHPDLDRSKGMECIIQKFVDENTQIWIPEGIDENEIDCSQKVRNLFKKLKQCVTRIEESYSVYSASDVKDLLCYNTFCFAKRN